MRTTRIYEGSRAGVLVTKVVTTSAEGSDPIKGLDGDKTYKVEMMEDDETLKLAKFVTKLPRLEFSLAEITTSYQ